MDNVRRLVRRCIETQALHDDDNDNNNDVDSLSTKIHIKRSFIYIGEQHLPYNIYFFIFTIYIYIFFFLKNNMHEYARKC